MSGVYFVEVILPGYFRGYFDQGKILIKFMKKSQKYIEIIFVLNILKNMETLQSAINNLSNMMGKFPYSLLFQVDLIFMYSELIAFFIIFFSLCEFVVVITSSGYRIKATHFKVAVSLVSIVFLPK